MHGVKFTFVFESMVHEAYSEDVLNNYYQLSLLYFDRAWSVFEGFPLDEYRIIMTDEPKPLEGGEYVWGYSLDSTWLIFDEYDKVEKKYALAHGTGHSWIGNTIPFDSGWIVEGLNTFLEQQIAEVDSEDFFIWTHNEDYYEHEDEPLSLMYENLFGTDEGFAYYAKGGLFGYLMSEKIESESDYEYKDLMKYFYDKFLKDRDLTNNSFSNQISLTDSHDLKEDIEIFSGIDFDKLFNMYVFGTDVIDLKQDDIKEEYFINWVY